MHIQASVERGPKNCVPFIMENKGRENEAGWEGEAGLCVKINEGERELEEEENEENGWIVV